MSTIVSRLDIEQIFCDVDDFCNQWENLWQQVPQLPSTKGERRSYSRMHLSEVMTIVIAFHGSGYKVLSRDTCYSWQLRQGKLPNTKAALYQRFITVFSESYLGCALSPNG
ncbi:hypothetical protein LC605_21655 [Nostoc sp. CHAB 5836]|uniref:hypothetical protein n=1 Tax=Nostoc sp. CHAB 5836 TaxID=2780404 RepID=UPI001E304915|nr:hypothetical protein [Nostoc sp. CHAB 5836]MCC5617648.1 hypothetical protein [Nostoc sp. CHAB 5836]